jgi:hypothetical protein
MTRSIDSALVIAAEATRRLVRRRIAHQRGAAMVEAAVVLPVLFAFLPLMTWVKTLYDEKLMDQARTRRDVVYYASHNCEGFGAERQTAQALDLKTGPAGGVARKKGVADGTREATSTALGLAYKRRESEVRYYDTTRSVHGESWMMCNEKPKEGDLGGWFSYASGMFTGGAGQNGSFE